MNLNNFKDKVLNGKKKVIVTSALTYVNNIPHLGNMICILSADIYSRFLKKLEIESIYVLGTDEHGTTTETKALELNKNPREVCDSFHKIHTDIYNWFEIKPDCYGRTSDKENFEITIDIFNKLNENNCIIEKEIEQTYCENCEKFLSDRFVEGTCPFCGYEDARGDQCDKCGRLLNSDELINPKCKICKSTPINKKTKHLFIDLPKIEPELREWMSSVNLAWSDNAKTTANAWLKEGIKPRSITRDLKWGIPVPIKGYENKVFYCWFDAPIGYISITKKNRNDYRNWWNNPKETNLVQFMGKDNIVFHTILFPSFLIGAKDNYVLVDKLSVNEFLNYEEDKFSKSRHVGVFGDDAMNTGIEPDLYRYYLTYIRPEKNDTKFYWNEFQDKVNNELIGNLGNLIHRTFHFLNKNFDGIIKEVDNDLYVDDYSKVIESYTNIELRNVLKEILNTSSKANKNFQENEPWNLVKVDRERTHILLSKLANVILDLMLLISPIIPNKFQQFLKMVNFDKNLILEDIGNTHFKNNHKINEPKVLFKKIEDDHVKKLIEKYRGDNMKDTQKEEIKKNDNVFSFDKIELRVAKIKSVEKHPSADKLYIEKIDLGEEIGEKQIISGLKDYYEMNELEGKKIIVVNNLKKAKLRGEVSQGMLLAVEDKDGNVGLLNPSNSNPGDLVFVDGMDLNKEFSRITIDEFFSIKLNYDNKALFEGKQLQTISDKEILVDRKDLITKGKIE